MASSSIRRVKRAVESRYPVSADLGVTNCRRKRGQGAPENEWSEHAWGNAWDPEFASAELAARVKAWLKSSGLPVAVVIDYGSGRLHIAGSPLRNPDGTAVPPCAGGTDDDDQDDQDGGGGAPVADPVAEAPPSTGVPLVDQLLRLPGMPSPAEAVEFAGRAGMVTLGGLLVLVGLGLTGFDIAAGRVVRRLPGVRT